MPWHKVCHKWTLGLPHHPETLKFCTKAPTYPRWYQLIHLHDGDPAPFEIGGVDPARVRDGEGLAAIQAIATMLSPELAKTIHEAVQAGVNQLKKQLPANVSFEITSELHE